MHKNSKTKRNILEGLGHFVVEFEQLVLDIKIVIYTVLGQNGLKNIDYARVLLADQSAYPLVQKLRSLLAIHYSQRKDELKHLDGLFEFTIEIIQHRNFILHGSLFLDRSASDQFNAEIIKDKNFKEGVDGETRNLTMDEVNSLTEKITKAKGIYNALTLCIYEPDRNLKEKIKVERIKELKLSSKSNNN